MKISPRYHLPINEVLDRKLKLEDDPTKTLSYVEVAELGRKADSKAEKDPSKK